MIESSAHLQPTVKTFQHSGVSKSLMEIQGDIGVHNLFSAHCPVVFFLAFYAPEICQSTCLLNDLRTYHSLTRSGLVRKIWDLHTYR